MCFLYTGYYALVFDLGLLWGWWLRDFGGFVGLYFGVDFDVMLGTLGML